ncbi:10364_t:CDS:2 [Dentiscutata heterogama]|uniref:10364_t:CDS:1 n=1 Tax=Dentiscutata heterogama TaxID=1316150 RepID=A0ACA9LH47_9GLOM|nr:10364_t:CDS:2 [Dentiscutata heterogama]
MDLETSLRSISKRRLNQSTGSNRSDNETSEHVESNRDKDTSNLLAEKIKRDKYKKMRRKYVKKITRSANIDSYESLAKFYERQVEFLKRERNCVTRFFNNNSIQGDNLSIKVARLQILIDEGETNKARVEELSNNLYKRDTEIKTLKDNIKLLTKEKDDFKK